MQTAVLSRSQKLCRVARALEVALERATLAGGGQLWQGHPFSSSIRNLALKLEGLAVPVLAEARKKFGGLPGLGRYLSEAVDQTTLCRSTVLLDKRQWVCN